MSLDIISAVADDESWLVNPTPGYVLKFKETQSTSQVAVESGGSKIFVNVCHAKELPPPVDDLDEDELAAKLDAGDLSFVVPLSVGHLEEVLDKGGECSTKVDVLVNSGFFTKRLQPICGDFYRHYFCMVLCEAIQNKHQIALDPNKAIKLIKRTRMGDITPMRIRKKPAKIIVTEMKGSESLAASAEQISVKQTEGLTIKLLRGENMEIKMDLSSLPKEEIKAVRLQLSSERVLLTLGNVRSLYDFSTPFLLNTSTTKTKILEEKSALVVSVDILLP